MSGGTVAALVAVFVAGFALFMAAFFLRLARRSAAAAAEAEALRRESSAREARSGYALATVVDLGRSREVGGSEVRVDLGLEVRPPGGREYRARASWLLDLAALPQVQPGRELQVRVDAEDPQRIYPGGPWARFWPHG
jgi:hypothetical protein